MGRIEKCQIFQICRLLVTVATSGVNWNVPSKELSTSTKWSLEDRQMGEKQDGKMGENWVQGHRKSAGQNKFDSWFPTLWSTHVATGFVYDCLFTWESLGLLIVFYFKIQHSGIQVLCFYSHYIRKEQSENFLISPPPPTPNIAEMI